MRRVIVFLKAPHPGQVKTRMAAALDPEAAAAIYRVLIQRTLAAVEAMGSVELRYAPDDARAEILPYLQPGWFATPQGEGHLGDRLARAVDDAVRAGVTRLVIVGSDCPAMEGRDIDQALVALDEVEVVIGPAHDGGYWLLGLRGKAPSLFQDIPWSTGRVFETTLQRAEAAGLRVKVLRTLRDVDTLEDWRDWLRQAPR
jgi:rSAM/selenodomain-associated transferase 1